MRCTGGDEKNLGSTSVSFPELINFDFDGRGDCYVTGAAVLGGGASQWNCASHFDAHNNLPLVDDTGAGTSVTMTIDRINSGSFYSSGTGIEQLFLSLQTGNTLTFGGLTSGGLYDLVVYFYGEFTVRDQFIEGQNYSPFSFVASGAGTHEHALTGPDVFGLGGHAVSAFQLSRATAVPEPGTLALFGLGLAGIGFARRKKA